MAGEFQSRFSAVDFQRYKDFFPNFEAGNAMDDERHSDGVEFKQTRNSHSKKSKRCHEFEDQEGLYPGYGCHHRNSIAGYLATTCQKVSTFSSLTFLSSSSSLRPSSSLETLYSYSSSPSDSQSSCSSSPSTRKSKSRKATCPKRSPRLNDPKFTGVTFSVETSIAGNEPILSTKLNIRPSFRIRRCRRLLSRRSALRWRRLARDDHVSMSGRLDSESSSSGTDHDREIKTDMPFYLSTRTRPRARMTRTSALQSSITKSTSYPLGKVSSSSRGYGKQCESCKTRCTPLWRDAEDGTPLCNACGIRYKKYRIRCPLCWWVPRKDRKTFPRCAGCSVLLKICLPRSAQSIS